MAKKILLVDDDPLIRTVLGQALADAGYETEVAANGNEGLQKAVTIKPDLVVCDVRMPEMDGLTMVEKLRQDEWGKSVPVVMLSTDESTGTINQSLASGVTVYIGKGALTPEGMAEQITAALDPN